MMRYLFDCEFFDDGKTIDLISLGMVAEDGRELYACNLDARLDLASKVEWMRENVLAKLPSYGNKFWVSKGTIRDHVLDFMLDVKFGSLDRRPPIGGGKIEVWGYYSSYDWVVFCQLFGPMVDLPKQFPKYCRDLKQRSDDLGAPKFPKDIVGLAKHNALDDARWNAALYNYLSAFAEKEKK
jgi:hypothetical protein